MSAATLSLQTEEGGLRCFSGFYLRSFPANLSQYKCTLLRNGRGRRMMPGSSWRTGARSASRFVTHHCLPPRPFARQGGSAPSPALADA